VILKLIGFVFCTVICASETSRFPLTYSKPPPDIDGHLTDWEETEFFWINKNNSTLTGDSTLYQGDKDISAGVSAARDDHNLYFAFHVLDNRLVNRHILDQPYEGDAVEITFQKDTTAPMSNEGYMLVFVPQIYDSLPSTWWVYKENGKLSLGTGQFSGVEVRSSLFQDGYSLEIKIPLLNFMALAWENEPHLFLAFRFKDSDGSTLSENCLTSEPLPVKIGPPHRLPHKSFNFETRTQNFPHLHWLVELFFLSLFSLLFYFYKGRLSKRMRRFWIGILCWPLLTALAIEIFQGTEQFYLRKLSRSLQQDCTQILPLMQECMIRKICSGLPQDYGSDLLHLLKGDKIKLSPQFDFNPLELPLLEYKTSSGIPLYLEDDLLNSRAPQFTVDPAFDTLYILFKLARPESTLKQGELSIHYLDNSFIKLPLILSPPKKQDYHFEWVDVLYQNRIWERHLPLLKLYNLNPSKKTDLISINFGGPEVGYSFIRGGISLKIQKNNIPFFKPLRFKKNPRISFSGVPVNLNQQIITEGAKESQGFKNYSFPILRKANELFLYYTSVGYQFEKGAPYGIKIGEIDIAYETGENQTVDLINGLNIDSYFLGYLEQHPSTMQSRIGFLIQNDFYNENYHIDELQIPLKTARINTLTIRDQGTWDALFIRGITLGIRKNIKSALNEFRDSPYFQTTDSTIELKKALQKKLFSDHFIIYERGKAVATSFSPPSGILGNTLPDTDSHLATPALNGRTETFRGQSYLITELPLNYFDLLSGERKIGALHIYRPAPLLDSLTKWKKITFWIGLGTLCIASLLLWLGLEQRLRYKLLLSYALLVLTPNLIALFLIEKLSSAGLKREFQKTVSREIGLIQQIIEQEQEKLQIQIEQMLTNPKFQNLVQSPLKATALIDLEQTHRSDSPPAGPNMILALQLTSRDHSKNQWSKTFYFEPRTPSQYRNPYEFQKITRGGFWLHGRWGPCLVAIHKLRMTGDRTITLYALEPLQQKLIETSLFGIEGQINFIYANGQSLGQEALLKDPYQTGLYRRKIFEFLQTNPSPFIGRRQTSGKEGYSLLRNFNGEPAGLLSINYPSQKFQWDQHRILFVVGGSLLLTIIFTSAAALIFYKKLGRGMSQLYRGMGSGTSSRPGPPVASPQTDELSEIADTFRQVTRTLEQKVDQLLTINTVLAQLQQNLDSPTWFRVCLQRILDVSKTDRGFLIIESLSRAQPWRVFHQEHSILKSEPFRLPKNTPPGIQKIFSFPGLELLQQEGNNLPNQNIFPFFSEKISSLLLLSIPDKKQEVIGVLGLCLASEPASFSGPEIDWVKQLGNFLSPLIENALQFERSVWDPYSGCYQHPYFLNWLEQQMLEIKKNPRPLSVVLIKIKNFSQIVDRFGAATGQDCLRTLCKLSQQKLADQGIIARLGMDCFEISLLNRGPEETEVFIAELKNTLAEKKQELEKEGIPAFEITGQSEEIRKDLPSIENFLITLSQKFSSKNKIPQSVSLPDQGAAPPPHPPRIINEKILIANPRMERIFQMADQLADHEATLLIEGESGTGKTLLAEYIYTKSSRYHTNFVVVDLSTVPETLFESELFGHTRGAFSGADREKPGKLEQANQGTCVLDKIENLSLLGQTKLLEFMENKKFRRIGSSTDIKLSVRLIVTTQVDLLKLCKSGHFKEDLYYRLNVVKIQIPPLRERPDEISPLSHFFIKIFNPQEMDQLDAIDDEIDSNLFSYRWPGNIRELKHYIEKAVLFSDRDKERKLHFPPLERDPHDTNSPGNRPQSPGLQRIYSELQDKGIFLNHRQKEIFQLIQHQGSLTTREIVSRFKVSEVTAFRDLTLLFNEKLIKRKGKGRSTLYYIG